jgi:hypothetical protein
MFAIFCLRLAFGMIAALFLFPASLVNPRFYRTHFLTALAFTAAAVFMLWDQRGHWLWAAGVAMALAFAGSIVWSLADAPGGRVVMVLCALALAATLGLSAMHRTSQSEVAGVTPEREWTLAECAADDFTSAAVLGTGTTAMLMGHSYLIAPAMSLTPLLRLLAGFFVALFLRMALAAWGLWSWTATHSLINLSSEDLLWLPVRWLVGFAAPLILGWMAWQTAKIRSTQSATGILYVVVICCYLGELISQLLIGNTGHTL